MTVKGNKFRRLRDAHNRETAEDYVEIIQQLVAEAGEARLTDVARTFGVSSVTAYKIVARLQREGFIATRPYRAIFLTAKGEQLATRSGRRHQIVFDFLRSIGVSDDAAHFDAEGIEHHVSPDTLSAFQASLRRRK